VLKFTLHDYEVIGSTNDEALLLYEKGAPEGTVVRAFQQTAGRGRRGRSWVSLPGNLCFSFVLKPNCSLMEASQLSFVMAVAMGEVISPLLPSPNMLTYKWPNDLLLDNKKVAGILIQTESNSASNLEVCIVGVGINIQSVPDNLTYPVTGLSQHSSEDIDVNQLLSTLLKSIDMYYTIWQQQGFEPIRKLWLQRAHSLQQEMTIKIGEISINGIFMGINSLGVLLFKQSDGSIREFASIDDLQS
jgi:BirA family biotin operon repressor/biotin-[acetyl-CoA-carboxylase] ligase